MEEQVFEEVVQQNHWVIQALLKVGFPPCQQLLVLVF